MKPAVFSLNPYAAPFIPLSRQTTDDENIAPAISESNKINEATTQYKQVAESETNDSTITCKDYRIGGDNPQHQLPDIAALNINSSSIEGQPDSGDSLGKDSHTHIYEDPLPHKTDDRNKQQSLIEDYELDLAYLAAAFPRISEQSLVDVYCANDGDLEDSVDMLIQLEDTSHESDTVDDASSIQNTTAYGEEGGSSHPSCSASAFELQISGENPQHQLPDIAALNINSSSIEGQPDSGDSLGKDSHTHIYEDPLPHKTGDRNKQQSLIDYVPDLVYLASAFPDISVQSLVDVYCANDGDLEDSVDMLIQLEDTSHKSDTVDDASSIQNTTAYGEEGGSSHPSCSASD